MPIDVKVPAKTPWTDTGVVVEEGKEILVAYVSGTWTCNPKSSAGYDAHGFDKHPAKKDYVVEGVNEGGLVGKVGERTFWIGRVGVVRGVGSGKLFLGINDDQNAKYGAGYKDNDGELLVRITVSDVALPAAWMLVDADRNDTLSSQAIDQWAQGPNSRGAILIPNESGSAGTRVSTPLVFQIAPGAALPMRGRIEVDRADRIRVLAAGEGGAEPLVVLGEASPDNRIAQHGFDLAENELRFEMEATRYLRRANEDPFVTLTFTPQGGEPQRAKLRVAPWLMMHHGDAPELVYVAAPGPQDPTFRPIVEAWPLPIQDLAVPDNNSVFIQDGVEIGYARASAQRTKFQGLRSPVPRWLTRMTTEVLGFDVIQVEATHESIDNHDTGRAFGNLEVTPPIGTYGLGRIYYSPQIEQVHMDFLNAQRVQRPFVLDASWLAVGHVDEVVCFLPLPGQRAVALVPSPRLAYRLICETALLDPGARLLVGRKVTTIDSPNLPTKSAEQSLVDFLKQPGIPAVDSVSLGGGEDDGNFDADTLRKFGAAVAGLTAQDELSAQYASIRDALAQHDRFDSDSVQAQLLETVIDVIFGTFPPPSVDIVEVPVLFYTAKKKPEALTANLANLLVLGARCLFPRPFGPIVTRPVRVTSDLGGGIDVAQGQDVFEAYMTAVLAHHGFIGTPIDTWAQYHLQHGEIHCATNVKRVPGATLWWTLPGLQ